MGLELNTMTPDEARLADRQRDRYAVLKAIYDAANGVSNVRPVDASRFDGLHGLDLVRIRDAAAYLEGKRLIRGFGTGLRYILTPYGVEEIEASIANPNASTPHFQPLHFVVNNHFNASVGAVQQGSHSVANLEPDAELHRLFVRLREQLPDIPPDAAETLRAIERRILGRAE